jgi:hypothetical protein
MLSRAMTRGRQLVLVAVVQVLAMATWFSASAVVPALRAEWDVGSRDAQPGRPGAAAPPDRPLLGHRGAGDRGRGFVLGVAGGALTLGGAVPHLLVGAELPWRRVLYLSALLALLAGVLAAGVPRRQLREARGGLAPGRADGGVLRDRRGRRRRVCVRRPALGFLLTVVTIQATPLLIDAAGWRVVVAVLGIGPVIGAVAMARLQALTVRASAA